MTDIAPLGFSIDTSSLKIAQTEAQKTAAEFTKMADSIDRANAKVSAGSTTSDASVRRLAETAKTTQAAVANSASTTNATITSNASTATAHLDAEIAKMTRLANSARTMPSATRPVSAFQTSNISAQLQDVAVSASMGGSPLQIALAQGTQLSSVLATTEKPLSAMAAGFGALLNPISLATIGVVGLSAAAITMFSNWKSGTEKAGEALSDHLDLIVRVKDAYKNAGAGIAEAMPLPEGLLAARASASRDLLRVQYQREIEGLYGQGLIGGRGSIGAYGTVGAPARQIPELREALEIFDKSSKAPADVNALASSVAKVRLSDDAKKGTRKFADNLLDALTNAIGLSQALPDATRTIDAASRNAERLASRLKGFGEEMPKLTSIGQQPLSQLQQVERQYVATISQATNREQRDDAAEARNRALSRLQHQLDLTRQADDLGTKAILARTASEKAAIAVAQARIEAERQGGKSPEEVAESERAARANIFAQSYVGARSTLENAQRASSMAGLAGLPAQIAEIRARYSELIRDADGATAAVTTLRQAEAVEIQTAQQKAEADPLRQAATASAEMARQIETQRAAFGKSAGEVGYLAEKLKLYNQYAAAGVEITPQLSRAIEAQAIAASRNAEAQDKANKAQSDSIQRMDQFRSASRSALGSLFEGDFSGALTGMIDGLQGMVLDELNKSLFGRQGEAGGGLFGDAVGGALDSLFGTGARGDNPNNPVYVSFGAGSSIANSGTSDDAWNSVFPSRTAANTNAFGLIGGTSLTGTGRASGPDALYAYARQLGFSDVQAAALVGNMRQESNFNPAALNKGEGAYGLIQWRQDRRNALNAYAGDDVADPYAQMRFLRSEMLGSESRAGSKFLASTDLASANNALKGFIRYGDDSQGLRLDYAQQALDQFGQKVSTASQSVEQFGTKTGQASQTASGGLGLANGGYPASLTLTPAQASMMPAGVSPYGTGWADAGAFGFGDLFSSLTNSLGGLLGQFGNIFTSLFKGLLGGLGGGGGSGGGILSSLLGLLFNADGNVFQTPSLHRYANQIVDRPTFFAFASGGGIMGEAGPEAIMPLKRTSDGKLGVAATPAFAPANANVAGASQPQSVYSPTVNIAVQSTGNRQQDEALAKRMNAEAKTVLDQHMIEFLHRESRNGGMIKSGKFS